MVSSQLKKNAHHKILTSPIQIDMNKSQILHRSRFYDPAGSCSVHKAFVEAGSHFKRRKGAVGKTGGSPSTGVQGS